MVDHFSENSVNNATGAANGPSNDGVDAMIAMIFWGMQAQVVLEMWKGDVSKAYPRCPASPVHEEILAVVFKYMEEIFISIQRSMPMGASRAVQAFHRVADLMLRTMVVILRFPV